MKVKTLSKLLEDYDPSDSVKINKDSELLIGGRGDQYVADRLRNRRPRRPPARCTGKSHGGRRSSTAARGRPEDTRDIPLSVGTGREPRPPGA